MGSTTEQPRGGLIFVLGPPGSGKGTTCKLAIEKSGHGLGHQYRHLSLGDHLRELCKPQEHENPDIDYERIRRHLRVNQLLPSTVLNPVLQAALLLTDDGPDDTTTTWLIDGFPRDMEQALAFEEKLGKPVRVIILECTRDVAQHRFLNRGRERADDLERFNRRYDEYVENMKEIRPHYTNITQSIEVVRTALHSS
ncbi:P-loop containing nucleoside triphosphate hydrolase protein [Xylaria arbuscula]|nr:P-loop containing nucleoside triphosphate hydrolase protein [Xylaria arbuscula]